MFISQAVGIISTKINGPSSFPHHLLPFITFLHDTFILTGSQIRSGFSHSQELEEEKKTVGRQFFYLSIYGENSGGLSQNIYNVTTTPPLGTLSQWFSWIQVSSWWCSAGIHSGPSSARSSLVWGGSSSSLVSGKAFPFNSVSGGISPSSLVLGQVFPPTCDQKAVKPGR